MARASIPRFALVALIAGAGIGCPDFTQAPGADAGADGNPTSAGATRGGDADPTMTTAMSAGPETGIDATSGGRDTTAADTAGADTSAADTTQDDTGTTMAIDPTTGGGGSTDAGSGSGSGSTGVPNTNCVPQGALPFDGNWLYFDNGVSTVAQSGTETLTLIPDNMTNAAAAVFYDAAIPMPYTVNFEYLTLDDGGSEGGTHDGSAHGLVVMLNKDPAPYVAGNQPPSGFNHGFLSPGGWGVHFVIYNLRRIVLRNGDLTELASHNDADVYTNGQWESVSVTVTEDSISVTFENNEEILHNDTIDPGGARIGFGASTIGDGQNAEFSIRNVEIECGGA